MKDLEFAASLLECYIVSNNKKDLFALFDLDTGKQCSHFYTLPQWAELNEAEEVLSYVGQ